VNRWQRLPSISPFPVILGNDLQQRGDYVGAIREFRGHEIVLPRRTVVSRNLAQLLLASGEHELAIASFRDAIRAEPGDIDSHYGIAASFYMQQRFPQAEAAFLELIALVPNHPTAHQGLGAVYLGMEDGGRAAAAFARAIEVTPGSAEAHAGLGTARAQQGRYAEAAASFEEAVALNPDNPAFAQNLKLAKQRGGLR
jgi:tetratricopeptide (TPR) repeat protein